MIEEPNIQGSEPSLAVSFPAGAPTGLERVTQSDLGIPRIKVIQQLSPEVNTSSKDYETKKIEGAAPGMMFNSQSRELLYSGNPFIPCCYWKTFNEFKPRSQGGGFVAAHTDLSILVKASRGERGLVLPGGNELNECANYAILYWSAGRKKWLEAVLPLSSTQLSKSRQLLNRLTAAELPIYANVWRVKTVPEQNTKGSWFGLKFQLFDEENPSNSRLKDPELIARAIKIAELSAEAMMAGQEADNDAF